MDADDGWLRRAGGLTVQLECDWPTDQIEGGRILAARLIALGRGLGCADPAHSPCLLQAHTDGALLCRLAADLATRCALPSVEPATGADLGPRFLAALADAAGAVYFCRRVQHSAGTCWFSTGGADDDLCGRVLAGTHTAAA